MTNGSPRRLIAGFTLLEVMITVVIVGILASIALPSYNYFITRSRITEATNTLSNMRTQMEKWFMDHRTYDDGTGKCGIEAAVPNLIATYNADANNKFTIDCPCRARRAPTGSRPTGGGSDGRLRLRDQRAERRRRPPAAVHGRLDASEPEHVLGAAQGRELQLAMRTRGFTLIELMIALAIAVDPAHARAAALRDVARRQPDPRRRADRRRRACASRTARPSSAIA